MTNQELFEGALHLLALPTDAGENDDYEERAPFLLASFCHEALELDSFLRMASGITSAVKFTGMWLSLDDTFPLLEALAPAACLYLAAMLVLDEDTSLSDRLYEIYTETLSNIRAGISCTLESITDCYFQ